MKKLLFIFIAANAGFLHFFDVETAGFSIAGNLLQGRGERSESIGRRYAPLSDLSFYGRDWFYAFNLQDDLSYYDRNYTKQELFLNNYTYTNATLNNLLGESLHGYRPRQLVPRIYTGLADRRNVHRPVHG